MRQVEVEKIHFALRSPHSWAERSLEIDLPQQLAVRSNQVRGVFSRGNGDVHESAALVRLHRELAAILDAGELDGSTDERLTALVLRDAVYSHVLCDCGDA